MRFDERYIEELKGRLRPSEVIGRTVKLKRQGREWVGLSPFTKEKSPSFFVNDDKGFFHDFSSGKHGDIISFLQETERLSFVEAVSRLAGEAGMALPPAADTDDDGLVDRIDGDGDGQADDEAMVRRGEDDPRMHLDVVSPGALPFGFTNPFLLDVDGNGWRAPR